MYTSEQWAHCGVEKISYCSPMCTLHISNIWSHSCWHSTFAKASFVYFVGSERTKERPKRLKMLWTFFCFLFSKNSYSARRRCLVWQPNFTREKQNKTDEANERIPTKALKYKTYSSYVVAAAAAVSEKEINNHFTEIKTLKANNVWTCAEISREIASWVVSWSYTSVVDLELKMKNNNVEYTSPKYTT